MSGTVFMGKVVTKDDFKYGTAEENFVRKTNVKLPLVDTVNIKSNSKYQCPLCSGELEPIGWFRKSGLKKMLHECQTCGLAVFR